MKRGLFAVVAMVAMALATPAAQAHVLGKKTDKDAFKLRGDVAKQVSKYVFCLVKASTKCEKKGADGTRECDLETGDVSYEPVPGKETAKFQAGIAKCDSKINLSKKGFSGDYVAIGCPGDCDDGADGIQECSGLPQFQGTVQVSSKSQLGVLQDAIAGVCAADATCAVNTAKLLTKYAQGLFKCAQKCELDEKGTKGGGSLTNAPVCMVTGTPLPGFSACHAKVAGKVTGKTNAAEANVIIALGLNQVLDDATDGLFNRRDPTGVATDSPCGTCGDNVREGTEECDGADLGICGACDSDCTCM